jgi:hypothetical protein
MHGPPPTRTTLMLLAGNSAELSTGRLVKVMGALWLAGVAMRMTILAMPPVIPLVHTELRMTETQVGLLIGLPLLLFALAAIPGSLLIARIGPGRAVLAGMVIAALAGAARGLAIDVATLYAAALATGFGVAIMQPSMPVLVREWTPSRIALGTIAYTSGMLMGATFPPLLTLSYVLPHVGGSWRLNLIAWAVPALLIAPLFFLLSPRSRDYATNKAANGVWWPDFKDPLVWLLGLTFGSNNSPYFAISAFLGDYVTAKGADRGARCVASNGRPLTETGVAVPDLRTGAGRGDAGDDPGTDQKRDHRLSRRHRFRNGDDLDPDPGFGAHSRQTRRCRTHRRRHVHNRLCLRNHYSDNLRRTVGCDRKTVDCVCAAVSLRHGVDSARRRRDEVSSATGDVNSETATAR